MSAESTSYGDVRAAMGLCVAAVAVLLIPATSSIKDLLRLDIPWIDPTLLLAPIAFIFLSPRLVPQASLAVVAAALLSCLSGAAALAADGSYVVLREFVRLLLNLVWFWVVVEVVRRKPKMLLNTLAVTVIIQLAIAAAISIVLAALGETESIARLEDYYGGRQVVSLGAVKFQRFMGTFFEGPPFGLFMLCSLVVLLVGREHLGCTGKLSKCGVAASVAGIIGAFADQVFLGSVVFMAGLFIRRTGAGGQLHIRRMVGLAIGLAVAIVVAGNIARKATQLEGAGAAVMIGASGGERMYHLEHATASWAASAGTVLFGIGPGRYGEVAARNGPFTPTTTIQVTFVEWLAEYGVVGFLAIVLWLRIVLKSASGIGWLGSASFWGLLVAVAFQANWKVESWFMALAVQYAVGESEVRRYVPGTPRDRGRARGEPSRIRGFGSGMRSDCAQRSGV